MLLLNLKTYPETTGGSVLALAQICAELGTKFSTPLVLAPQTVDLRFLHQHFPELTLFAQHLDPHLPGKGTGSLTYEAAVDAGACGTLLNHPEYPLERESLACTLSRLPQDFTTVVCAHSPEEILALRQSIHPSYIAYEPPNLIGGGVPVTTAYPELISEAARAAGDIPLLVGAGIKFAEDVRTALSLGARGILIASGVVKSSDPRTTLTALLSAF